MKRKLASIFMMGVLTLTLSAAPSILDIKHSITDDNIVPPESFETKSRELEETFYLNNYALGSSSDAMPEKLGTASEYEKRLSKIPSEIEMPYNSVVGKYIDMYVGKRRGMVSNMLALHNYYGPIFLEELEKEGMPTELQYLPVIESALKPDATSRVGAAGLWQFMPATARGLGMEVNSLVDERRDPRSSSRNAARYLKELHNIYNDWSLAIAAYNCGPGNVNKALRRAGGGKKDFWEIYPYLPAETRGYVPAFIAANYAMNYYKNHNISPRVISKHLVTDTVLVNKRVHFNQIAGVLNIPVDEIRMLNPQYRKDVIPGDVKPYPLVLPSQQVLSYVMSEPQILAYDEDIYRRRTYVEPSTAGEGQEINPDVCDPNAIQPDMAQSLNATENYEISQNITEPATKKYHIVGRGENLRDIARQYGVSATDIKHWNNLRRGKVKEGDKLVIETYQSDFANATISSQPTQEGVLVASRSAVPAPQRKSVADAEPVAVPAPAPKQDVRQQPAVPARAVAQISVDELANASQPAVPQRRPYSSSSSESAGKTTEQRVNYNTREVVAAPEKPAKPAKQEAQASSPRPTNRIAKADIRTSSAKDAASDNSTASKSATSRSSRNADKSAKNSKSEQADARNSRKNRRNSKATDESETTSKSSRKKGSSKAARQESYTIKEGDNLERIAKRNGTTVEELRKANNISGSNIRTGNKLVIPAKEKASTSKKSKRKR